MAQPNPAAALANIYKTPELWDKIKFTFLCLLIYRVGAHITAPAICTKIDAEMYGMMPSANTVARDSWPPTKRS